MSAWWRALHIGSDDGEISSRAFSEAAQAFMDKEAGPEGAEVPSAVPAAGGRDKVSMDYKRFWRELGNALGVQPGISKKVLATKLAQAVALWLKGKQTIFSVRCHRRCSCAECLHHPWSLCR